MTEPEVVHYTDGHYRQTIYGLGPYIADYPEQTLLACVVQGWCAKCVLPSSCQYFGELKLTYPCRCDAHRDDLDGDSDRRTHAVTDYLLDALDLKHLWDEYGIVGDLLVSCTYYFSSTVTHNVFVYQPFTVAFPRADLHEMLSPDLLHQLIKGTFKDHLVSWVEEYLVITYGKTRAETIIADIDRRYVL